MNKMPILLMTLIILCSCQKTDSILSPLSIQTENGELTYNVETAISDKELEKGLMDRDTLDTKSGMIFDLSRHQDRPTAMWMKNTKISLDVLFIDDDNKIFWIKEKTTPMSEEIIIAPAPAKAFVELNAGEVEKHQIKVGQTVNHAILKPQPKK
ncbi:MAG: DUF192 domain-containing protein [Alphaproteobacteria bacterium]|nr:DUF192 domain-containing protein [Alphaproteobacteria bacterium]